MNLLLRQASANASQRANSPKNLRMEPLNQSSHPPFQTIWGPFSLSQRERAGVRENRLVVNPVPVQRAALSFCFGCLAAGAAFLAFLSIIYDFGICMDPSREHPYFAEGRLILGAMVPGLLVLIYGLDYLLRGAQGWAKTADGCGHRFIHADFRSHY